jgi:hypothetical protein
MRGPQSDKSHFHQIERVIKRKRTKQNGAGNRANGLEQTAESERTTHDTPETKTQKGLELVVEKEYNQVEVEVKEDMADSPTDNKRLKKVEAEETPANQTFTEVSNPSTSKKRPRHDGGEETDHLQPSRRDQKGPTSKRVSFSDVFATETAW